MWVYSREILSNRGDIMMVSQQITIRNYVSYTYLYV